MKATFISRENNDVKFTMEFTAEEFEQAQVKVYQRNKGQFEIDGFRKGKAPRSIIEKKYGEGIFIEDAIDDLFSAEYPKAVNELDLEVIASPRAEFSQIKKGEGFTMTMTVACFPIVEVKNYKGVEIDNFEQEVKEEDIDSEIAALQKRNARRVLVERPAQQGDTVLLDYSGFVGEEQFEGGTAERQKLTLGSNMFIPGFEDQLVGVTPGEKKDVVVTFPEEYHAEELAGKEAVFHCLVHEIEEEQLPELDDEFAQDVSEFDTLEELRQSTRAKLEEYAQAQTKNVRRNQALGKAVEGNEVEAPEEMVSDELDKMIQEMEQQMAYQGLSLEQYFQFTGMNMQQFKEEMKPQAETSVKTRIVLQNVAAQEGLDVTEADLEEQFKGMADQYGMDIDQVKTYFDDNSIKYLKKDLVVQKAADFIYDNAVVVEAPKAEEK